MGMLHDPPHIDFQQLVQLVHPDVVGAAPGTAPAVVGAAGVGGTQIPAAHGKHGAAAVPAEQEAGVHVIILLHAPVIGGGTLLPEGPGGGEGAVVNDGLVVVLNDDMLLLVPFHILAVDLGSGVFGLAESADIKIVIQNSLHRDDGPSGFRLSAGGFPRRLLAHLLRHPWRWNALLRQVVGNFLVAPALVVVQVKNLPDDFRFCRDDLKFFLPVDDIAVGGGAKPFPVGLPPPDDVFHLLAGVGDRHFVDEKLKLDFQPVVIVGKVDVVPNGNDANACIPQILQFHQPPGISPGESGKILHHQNVILMPDQPLSHGLVTLPLFKSIAGTVPILIKGQAASRKTAVHKIPDDGLLVFNGNVIPVQFLVYGDAAVAGNVKGFGHGYSPLRYFSVWRSNSEI